MNRTRLLNVINQAETFIREGVHPSEVFGINVPIDNTEEAWNYIVKKFTPLLIKPVVLIENTPRRGKFDLRQRIESEYLSGKLTVPSLD